MFLGSLYIAGEVGPYSISINQNFLGIGICLRYVLKATWAEWGWTAEKENKATQGILTFTQQELRTTVLESGRTTRFRYLEVRDED